MQRIHVVKDRFRPLVSMEEQGTLKKGDVVDRPYRSGLAVNDMGSEGSYARQAVSDTGETLTVNKKKEVSFYIQSVDEIQSNYKSRNMYAKDAAVKLGNQIDGDVFGEYDAADSIVDDGDVGGTDGSATRPHDYGAVGLTLGSSNVLDAVLAAAEKLDALNIDTDKRFGAISPQFVKQLRLYTTGRQTGWGDAVGKNGHIGLFENFEMYHTNNLSWTARLEMGTKPIDGDTIVINGVTLTFKDTIGTTAGNVMICDSGVPETLDNLVLALTTPGTSITTGADAGYVAVSAANQRLLANITAYDGTTYLGIEKTGASYCVVSETLTAGADIWTANKQIQHNLFGRKGAIDLVIQKYANMNAWHRDGYIGYDIVTWQMYGIKTFDEGDAELVDLQIRSDGF